MSVKVLADHKRGMNEHQILRKHLVPKPQSAEMYTWRDLSPGRDINLFGRVDRFRTNSYYKNDNFIASAGLPWILPDPVLVV